jgi:hypothetical protein
LIQGILNQVQKLLQQKYHYRGGRLTHCLAMINFVSPKYPTLPSICLTKFIVTHSQFELNYNSEMKRIILKNLCSQVRDYYCEYSILQRTTTVNLLYLGSLVGFGAGPGDKVVLYTPNRAVSWILY